MDESDDSTEHARLVGAERHIRVVGTTVEWCCRACSRWQQFDHELCDACGTPRRRFHRPKAPSTVEPPDDGNDTPERGDAGDTAPDSVVAVAPQIDDEVAEQAPDVAEQAPDAAEQAPDAAEPAPVATAGSSTPRIAPLRAPTRTWPVAASIVLPGSGHMVLRRFGTGLTRMVVFVAWMTSGAIWLGDYAAATQRAVWAVLAGIVVLGVSSAVDVAAIQRGEPELVGPRGLLALVIAVTLAILVVPRGELFWGWMIG